MNVMNAEFGAESTSGNSGASSSDSRDHAGIRLAFGAWLLGVLAIAGIEWALLLWMAADLFTGLGQALLMLPLQLGNLLPYGLAMSLGWLAIIRAEQHLRSRLKRPAVATVALAGLLTMPYAVWLAAFVFSGPTARTYSQRPLLIGVLALGIAAVFMTAAAFCLWRARSQKWWVAIALGLLIACGLALWGNAFFLPDEYAAIHTFLGICGLCFGTLLGREVWPKLAAALQPQSAALGRAAVAVTVLWMFVAAAVLARAEEYAWILWGETGASRYITSRWTFLGTKRATGPRSLMTLKPRVETSEAVASRELRASRPPPNIVVFSVDGLRPDHVGAYGYNRHPTTPNIDRVAKRGRLFRRAYSSYPKTQNFNASLLLGRFVPQFSSHNAPRAYQEQAITRFLDKRDYHMLVKSWFEHSTKNTFDPAVYRIDTHVKKSEDKSIRLEAPLHENLAAIEKHLAEAKQKSLPVLIWTHLLGTHVVRGEFVPDESFPFGEERLDRYDSAIAGSDAWLPEYERLMAKHGDPQRETIWIVCSDHGIKETTGGRDLSNGLTHVPLVVAGPGIAPGVDDHLVDVSLDLAATIVDLIGFAPPPTYDGVSLVPLLYDSAAEEEMKSRVIPLAYSRWKGAIYQNYKYREQRDGRSLFDIVRDPKERQNLIGKFPELAAQMAEVADEALERRTQSYNEGTAGPANDSGDED